MITGIIQATGTIAALQRRGSDARLQVATGTLDISAVRPGASIAVNGVCLTVVTMGAGNFSADVSAETLRCTTFDGAKIGDTVNLEKALTLGTPLGGHQVSGHVDGVAPVGERAEDGGSLRLTFPVPAPLAKYVAAKVSICIDGVSLT